MRVTREHNLGKLYPDLVKEWNLDRNGELTPYEVTPGSTRKVWWQCKRGHEWKSSLQNRTYFKTGCPYCANRKEK